MNILYKKYTRSLQWNTLEALIYQTILVSHQLLLFSIIDPSSYGLIGTLFSSIYLMVPFINGGLDGSLAPFFDSITQSKQSFRALLIPHYLPELLAILLLMVGWIIAKEQLISLVPPLSAVEGIVIFSIFCIILSEGLKKTFRTLLQLAFLNHKTALIELVTIVSYTGMIWIAYFSGYPINLSLIFVPMALTSFISTALLAYNIYHLYKELPDNSHFSIEPGLTKRMIKSRVFMTIHYLSHMIFSSNFLIPLYALSTGLQTAGIFKLVSTCIYAITTIVYKIFGLTSEALLTQVRNLPQESRQEAFASITQLLHQVVYGLLIFFMINYSMLLKMQGTTAELLPLIGLFFILQISDYFFIVYERLYTIYEQAQFLCLFNAIVMLLLWGGIQVGIDHGPLITLIIMIMMRVISFIILSLFSWYRWSVQPSWKIQPMYMLGAIFIALAFRFIMH